MTGSGVTYAQGFTAAGVACGIKKKGGLDLAVVKCDVRARAAGIFTRNIVKGHSLRLARKNVRNGYAQLVVINSGCANACLGPRGDADALEMARLAANRFGVRQGDVLPGSTGVIGVPLPLDKIAAGLDEAILSRSGGADAARAIMTTDTVPKEAQADVTIGGRTVRIGGMAKGSGMIHPNMATLISVLTTDAAISVSALRQALREAAAVSYNRISVDGDTSVCDKVLILASGLAGNDVIEPGTEEYARFTAALKDVCIRLAKMLAADGEGATKLLTIQVKNARSARDAHLIASAIAKSPLCKTAAFGNDANWGRLLTAAGYSGARFNPEKVDIWIGSVKVCENGGGLPFDEEAALRELKQREVTYTLDFADGTASDTMWTCDFSLDYVKINADYRT
ncbi:MAG: bifunctional glutamate N-acetyltransferase/amino-acid acetyltransferase ArgJ [Christensenellaceae bacterium]|nr:bifunctional glutamate N-acetyltransferase/amino-acid acetyltransferase ArgJ [Christensenellaceae bacterium]